MLGVFWNHQDLLLMVGTEIFKIDAPWVQKLMKTRVSFLMTPTVVAFAQKYFYGLKTLWAHFTPIMTTSAHNSICQLYLNA